MVGASDHSGILEPIRAATFVSGQSQEPAERNEEHAKQCSRGRYHAEVPRRSTPTMEAGRKRTDCQDGTNAEPRVGNRQSHVIAEPRTLMSQQFGRTFDDLLLTLKAGT